ncbi:PAS domain-containing protein [Halanaerobium kushneri]|uniref:PAS domain S-box-containing protein n=1 Tax=Halanaerobium kushneri TaxID=56779 RepID=A0A1N6RHY3_9FIRM|nr:PAS domain-containing protein [Halanaerobium kushneri]SIQ28407.1 PAS domain S-box-containing protein [Halanaerobium kushneri]
MKKRDKRESMQGKTGEVISEEKMKERIKQREKMFASALNEAPIPVMIHAEDGEVVIVNNTWIEISGYSKQEIRTIFQWIKKAHRGNIKEIKQEINKSFAANKSIGGEFEIFTKDGEKRIWDFKTAPWDVMKRGANW